jgi:hypothetical protein
LHPEDVDESHERFDGPAPGDRGNTTSDVRGALTWLGTVRPIEYRDAPADQPDPGGWRRLTSGASRS